MHRRLGGRIGSPHFFDAHAKYPESGEALATFSRNYAELYWDFNESIPRSLGVREVPKMGLFSPPRYSIFSGDHGLLVFIDFWFETNLNNKLFMFPTALFYRI